MGPQQGGRSRSVDERPRGPSEIGRSRPLAAPLHMRKTVPLIMASALIMQQIDSAALATALPTMASSLEVPAVRLHTAITIYLLALGVFLPLSGWIADRFGAKKVFCAAIALFTVASLSCAAANSLTPLLLARAVQGFGAALMLPVARLILVRSVPRSELVSAMVLMSMPTVIGPALGPLLGGFVTSVASWRWIFWINLPVGVLAIALTLLWVAEIPPAEPKPFDTIGFVLTALGIGALIFGLDSASSGASFQGVSLVVLSVAATWLYVRHARRNPNPILDLGLFRHTTFRASLVGGSLFRLGVGALPFMLPLLLQEVFGYSPLESGAITFVSGLGAFGVRALTQRILHRFGFRRVLVCNALLASASMAACAAFTAGTAPWIMSCVIFLGGVFRALQFTSITALAFADVASEEMSHATALTQMAQRISLGAGVAFAAILLRLFSDGAELTNGVFSISLLTVAAVSALSYFSFLRLPESAGDVLRAAPRR